MTYREELEEWLINNYLDFNFIEDGEDVVFEIPSVGKFFLFDSGEESVFDDEFKLNLSSIDTDCDELLNEGWEYTAYKFGDVWYYTKNDDEAEYASMTPLQSIGEAFLEMDDYYTHLGVHGFRELLNGSGQYEDYAKQAKFFGHKALGICEKNTLAGTLLFQNACKKYGIKPILGMTIDIVYETSKKEAKLYVNNAQGWKNLMNIANIINNKNHVTKDIHYDDLYLYGDGLIFVFGKDWIPCSNLLEQTRGDFDKVFYQLDTSEYSSDTIDKHFLTKTSEYISLYGLNSLYLQPILISDSYYVHGTDFMAKKLLNQIGIGASHLQSTEQFYKPVEHHIDKLEPLFKDEDLDDFDKLFDRAISNTMELAVDCDFEINTDYLNMPEYELTEDESKKYKDKYELFDAIVDSNWNDRVPEGQDDIYEKRLEEEFRVINGNGFLDYFLINWDWLEFCKRENIYTGIARGSAGGSVLSYLLGVTNIDPIKYDLLFERFLNEGRLKKTVKTRYLKFHNSEGQWIQFKEDKLIKLENKYVFANEVTVGDNVSSIVVNSIEEWFNETVTAGSPPDIDSDVESVGRQRVKEYLEERYGKHRVFSIGTFTSLGIKSAISDVARQKGVPVQTVKTVNKMITQKEVNAGFGFSDFFRKAVKNKVVKEFIETYPDILELVRVVMNNSKSQSVHAAGVIITPKYMNGVEVNAWDWTPTKFYDEQLVSEWEGSYLEQSGMLKLDLLGLNTLDKIHYVIDSVKETTGEEIDWHDIYINRLEDKSTYDIFKKGFTQNVFQFSGDKMTKFVQSMEPTSVNDIFAANALFRPATMNLGYHEDYVEMKHGRKEVEYDWGMEEITKDTYGILCYQEQHMKVVQKIGGFSLQEADDVRKAMGKKKIDLMNSYKEKFLEGAVANGCDEFDAVKIWNDVEQGAKYGFNASHAAAYGLESYVTAYLKAHYPVHFYTMSLAMANDDDRPNIISEIYDDGRISIAAPHINESGFDFETDFDDKKIYWSLKSTKMVGDVAVRSIIDIREEGGNYESLKDFVERTAGKKVNKTHIVNLILSGAFDDIEKLSSSVGRYGLIKWLFVEHIGEPVPQEKFPKDSVTKTFFWNRIQNELSGLGEINYQNVYASSGFKEKFKSISYLKPQDIHSEEKRGKYIGFSGMVGEIRILESKKTGDKFGKVVLQCNDKIVNLMVWFDSWNEYGDKLIKSKGLIITVNAMVSEDSYTGGNQLMTHKKTSIQFM